MSARTTRELRALRERLRRDVLALDEPASGGGLCQRSAALSRSDLDRARAEVGLAQQIAAVAASGEHCEDGHTTVAAWCRATRRWSMAETAVRVRLARLLAEFPDLADEMLDGRLGVAQANTIAKAAANPRCGDQIGGVLPILLDEAGKLSHADFQRLVGHWERIADADGAHRDADRSHRQRRASWGTDDDTGDLTLRLHCGAAQGAQIRAVLDGFAQAELRADWAACMAEHGDAATPDLLPRTDTQRRADAIVAMATAAASTPADAQHPEPLVNIVVDQHTFDHTFDDFLRHHAGATTDEGLGGEHDADERDGYDDGIDHLDFDPDLHPSAGPVVTSSTDHAAGAGGHDRRPSIGRDVGRPPPSPSSSPPPPSAARRWRGCTTTDGHPMPVADAIAAALIGRIRVVVTDERGVVLHMGRRQRLFTGVLREAVMLGAHHCVWNGCNRPTGHCHADHLVDWQHAGTTDIVNGAPLRPHHNRFKNHGYRVHRDDDGHWHTSRPDGTEL